MSDYTRVTVVGGERKAERRNLGIERRGATERDDQPERQASPEREPDPPERRRAVLSDQQREPQQRRHDGGRGERMKQPGVKAAQTGSRRVRLRRAGQRDGEQKDEVAPHPQARPKRKARPTTAMRPPPARTESSPEDQRVSRTNATPAW